MNRAHIASLVFAVSCATPKQSNETEAPAPVLDRALFFGDPAISQAQISPDGRFISFLKPSQGAQNIWLKTRRERFEEARPLTAETRSISSYGWSRDGRSVLSPSGSMPSPFTQEQRLSLGHRSG